MVISERDPEMLLQTPAPRKWTVRDVQEAAALRTHREMVQKIFNQMNVIEMVIVDETEEN